MIHKQDLESISIEVKDYGNGLYDTLLYYDGKLLATYICDGKCIINEENLEQVQGVEKLDPAERPRPIYTYDPKSKRVYGSYGEFLGYEPTEEDFLKEYPEGSVWKYD